MKHKNKNSRLAEIAVILSQIEPLELESKTWTIEIGKTYYSSDDFTRRKQVFINGEDVGYVIV